MPVGCSSARPSPPGPPGCDGRVVLRALENVGHRWSASLRQEAMQIWGARVSGVQCSMTASQGEFCPGKALQGPNLIWNVCHVPWLTVVRLGCVNVLIVA